jgi:hypothetical protein
VVKIEADYEATISHDSNYGADADGNRGIYVTFLDDIQLEELDLIYADGRKERVKFESLQECEQEWLLQMITEQAEAAEEDDWDPRDEPEYWES